MRLRLSLSKESQIKDLGTDKSRILTEFCLDCIIKFFPYAMSSF